MDDGPLLCPGFLIAEPELRDPNFATTVVLLIYHDGTGSFGLVLNHKTWLTLSNLLPEFENTRAADLTVYHGGPVEPNRLFTLHSGDSPIPQSAHAVQAAPGLVFEPDFDVVQSMLEEPGQMPSRLRFFVGYSGWGQGQLDEELAEHSWISSTATAGVAFSEPGGAMWKSALKQKGAYYGVIAETGFRPSLN